MILYYKEYKGHNPEILGTRKKFDNTIYTFDIETTSYLILNNKIVKACDYLTLSEKEKKESIKQSLMYVWQFGINEQVYYGRTWEELKEFLNKIEEFSIYQKFLYIHNASFEFQFLKSIFEFENVLARKSHKVMTADFRDYNFTIRCSYILSNCSLKYIPKVFNLDVEKKVGDLDYDLIRTPKTKLTEKELGYCEYDCLVLYYYIKREIEEYKTVKNIPKTSTGKVRRELLELTQSNIKYKIIVRKSINKNPIIFNRLQSAFMGGYTHSSFIYTDEILKNIDSYDEVSAYPYVLVSEKFPSTEFKPVKITKKEEMNKRLAYILKVKFYNIKSNYYNSFISKSKCTNIKGGRYDNGRIIEAEELEIIITDIDFYFILDTHKCDYEIIESYFSIYNYLPKTFINFVLDKYELKTKYKNLEGFEIEYQKEKNKFNALYGMSVTNNIKDKVEYHNDTKIWTEEELTNEEIIEGLETEYKKGFLSFSYGVWCTAYARDNLLRRVIELDDYVVYCDTDSIKLVEGYDKTVIEKYNESVIKKIEYVSNLLKISKDRYSPVDKKGIKHTLGLFEFEERYDEFITQGAKKYAVKKDGKIKITVAGVPKEASNSLKDLSLFRDNYVFDYKDTNKQTLLYIDEQKECTIKDYQGNLYNASDKSGCCLLPTTYILGKALEYADLIEDSSNRAHFKE